MEGRLVDELACAVVAEAAPEEAKHFPAIAAAVRRDPGRAFRRGRDDMLGFGVADAMALLSPIVLTVLTDVVSNKMTNLVDGQSRRLVRSLRRRWPLRRKQQIAPPEAAVPVLEPEAAEQAAAAAEEIALTLGVEEPVARVLRQALYGHLSGQR
ncbi:hypothetical protein ACQEVF_24785 [Nonomuraea polychroma]|uniref:hypothetical protein n=1 Tax=Nonomuraea polychroma TaxID=46176 RepID=UPI003D8E5FF3